MNALLVGVLTMGMAADDYWVQRSDAELQVVVEAACKASQQDKKPVLLAFSAPWCGDCQMVRKLETEAPLQTEQANWHKVVIEVGRFDRHTELLKAFKVQAIATWVALKPTDCSQPVTEWPVLKAGTFEPKHGATGPRTSEALAEWLISARN